MQRWAEWRVTMVRQSLVGASHMFSLVLFLQLYETVVLITLIERWGNWLRESGIALLTFIGWNLEGLGLRLGSYLCSESGASPLSTPWGESPRGPLPLAPHVSYSKDNILTCRSGNSGIKPVHQTLIQQAPSHSRSPVLLILCLWCSHSLLSSSGLLAWSKPQHLSPRFVQQLPYSLPPSPLVPGTASPCCCQSDLEAQICLIHCQLPPTPTNIDTLISKQLISLQGFPLLLGKVQGWAVPLLLVLSAPATLSLFQFLKCFISPMAPGHLHIIFSLSSQLCSADVYSFLKSQLKYFFFKDASMASRLRYSHFLFFVCLFTL